MAAPTRESGEAMAFDLIIGWNVVDAEAYRSYRAGMTPLLEAAGGYFAYDFDVARTHRNASAHAINRVFVIPFPGRAGADAYFADSAYVAARSKYFESAVLGLTTLGEAEH